MPKRAIELSAIQVSRLAEGFHAVGGVAGLYLSVKATGAKSWVLRYKVGKARRDMGLGSYPSVTLAQARDRAREAREQLYQGIDPLQAKRERLATMRAANETAITFAEWFGRYMKNKQRGLAATNARDWKSSITTYAIPIIGSVLLDDIETRHIKAVLEPIWYTKTSTADKLRGRIECVLSAATAEGYRSGDNPAKWAGNLKESLSLPSKVHKAQHHKAVAVDDAPGLIQRLREREGNAARALELLILTACRSAEIRGATWDEIDFTRGIWMIPGVRMKMDKPHLVPLSDAALSILQGMDRDGVLVFPNKKGRQLHKDTLLDALQRIADDHSVTVHGMRSTFKDWATERTDTPWFIVEMAQAHKVGNDVTQAYLRSDLIAKRRKLLRLWAQHLGYAEAGAKVVQIAQH